MAHKTLIDGTAYEISGGKTLIDSTAYEIDKGKSLIDGTAYEVGFEKPVVTIILEGDFSYSGVRYNGVYYGSNTITPITFTANVGDVLFVESYGYKDSPIYLNGTLVANVPSETEYYYTVRTDAVITAYAWGSSYDCSSRVNIIESDRPFKNISVVQNSGGMMVVSHTSAPAGTTITITPLANSGRLYESSVLSWVENGVQKTQALSMAQRTFVMPDADVTIQNIVFRQTYVVRIMDGATNGEDPIFTFPPNVSWEWIANSEYNTDIVNPNRKRLWIDYNGESWRDVRMGNSGYLCKKGWYDGYQVRTNFISTNGETYYNSGDLYPKNISVAQSSGGTMSVSHASALSGTTITISPTPSGGYWYESSVLSWNEGGVQKTQTLTMAQRTFVMPDADVTIQNIVFRRVYTIRIHNGATNGEDPIFIFPPNLSWEWIANSEYNTDAANPNRKRLWIDYNGESWRDVRLGNGFVCKKGWYDGYEVRNNTITVNGETYYGSGS